MAAHENMPPRHVTDELKNVFDQAPDALFPGIRASDRGQTGPTVERTVHLDRGTTAGLHVPGANAARHHSGQSGRGAGDAVTF